jgi:hypothetical protein
LLAYKIYGLKYMTLLDRMGGIPNTEALEVFLRQIEADFPNEKVHPGDVIIMFAALAWKLARDQNRSAKEEIQKIVSGWKGTGHRSTPRTDRPGDALRRKGFVLPN